MTTFLFMFSRVNTKFKIPFLPLAWIHYNYIHNIYNILLEILFFVVKRQMVRIIVDHNHTIISRWPSHKSTTSTATEIPTMKTRTTNRKETNNKKRKKCFKHIQSN